MTIAMQQHEGFLHETPLQGDRQLRWGASKRATKINGIRQIMVRDPLYKRDRQEGEDQGHCY